MALCSALVASLSPSQATAQISVTFSRPLAPPVDDPLPVEVRVNSPYQLTGVKATAGSHEVAMTLVGENIWRGTLAFTGEPFGTMHTLTVVATDVFGTTGTASQPIKVDRLPKLTVLSPLVDDSVARPN